MGTDVDIDALRGAAIFGELPDCEAAILLAVARRQHCRKGECLFVLGDAADRLFIVLSGALELSLPLSFGATVRDIAVEVKTTGAVLGWSALIKPYRCTSSARATEAVELAAFLRTDLLRIFAAQPRIGCAVMSYGAEALGRRLAHVQTLWVRELQRAVMRSLSAAMPNQGV